VLPAMNTPPGVAPLRGQDSLADRRDSPENRFQNRRVKLLFLIRNLAVGGSERQLVALAKGLDREIFDVVVMCFYADGPLVEELNSAGVRVVSLEKAGRWEVFRFLWRFAKTARELNPDILHSYLTGQNLLSVLVRPLLRSIRIVWGVRASYMDTSHFDWLEKSSRRLEILLSRFADLIIFNSNAGRDYHLAEGFADSRAVVIPNGIDTERFAPDKRSASRLRASWGVPEGTFLVGIVGRMDRMKDHETFLRAAAIFARVRAEARFVCVGDGPDQYSRDLRNLSHQLGLADKVIWAGFVHNMPTAYNALDICCSSSYGEGCSNAVAEAMSCGIPCVVTDVGDSRLIVDEIGIVVPPRNPEALAAGWGAMAERIRQNPELRFAVRERIISQFSLSALIGNTSEALLGAL